MMPTIFSVLICVIILAIRVSHSSSNKHEDYSEEDLDYDKDFEKFDPKTDTGSFEGGEPHPPGPLNLRGSLRQRFAMNAALVNPERSLICSPISALLPLGKLALGATGDCLEQLLQAIGLSSLSQLNKAFKPLIYELEMLKGVTLDVISKIYVSDDNRLTSKFRKRAKRIFQSTVESLNLKKPITAAREINEWVRANTQNMIQNIVSADDFSPWTSLVIVNAVYFSGKWLNPFERVEDKNFYTSTGTRKVPMMIREGFYNFTRSASLDAQIAEIPYEGEQASFVIVLPNTKFDLSVMLEKIRLAPELLQKAMANLEPVEVIVNLPKFKTFSQVDLNKAYEQPGITEMFQRQVSGLENIVKGAKKLHVSKAVQKAVIEVSEHGTEASGSSVMTITKLSLSLSGIIIADHPFLYIIKFKRELIFCGVFAD